MMDSEEAAMYETNEDFTPLQYLLAIFATITDFLMDRMVLVTMSFIIGAAVVIVVELLILWRHFNNTPQSSPPRFEDSKINIPEVLKSWLEQSNLKQKEDCTWLNFLIQFLFAEFRDSMQLRRFLTKKIQVEFEEVLRSRSGVLVDELFLRDFNLGESFPVILDMYVDKSEVSGGVIQTLDLKTNITYNGGFQIAIDAALPFHRMAFVSVTILKLRGLLRLQFTQVPFGHWNMAFYEEPELEVDVTAQLDGRPMPKLKNIIANQIKKIVRKKHTLPMYKIRYKPFFQPHLDTVQPIDACIYVEGSELGHGVLEVTIIEANQLPFVIKGAQIYCTVSVDELPWKEQKMKERKRRKVISIELVKISSDQSLGMMVKDELLPDRLHPVVVIGEVNVGSPAHMANLQQGDILIGVGGSKVTSAKQATKNLRWAKDRIQIQIERIGSEMSASLSTKDDVSSSPKKVRSWNDGQTTEKAAASDTDSIHTVTSVNSSTSDSPRVSIKPQTNQPEIMKTIMTESAVNPKFNHKFVFSVDPSQKCLNICLWCKGGDRSGRTDISSGKQDVILGYVTVNLDEVYLHCLVTLNGRLKDTVNLRHGHLKTQEELVKYWSVHKGWDMNQMYGNISLGFYYAPTHMSEAQRQDASSKLQKRLIEKYEVPKVSEERKPSPINYQRDLNEGHHQFGTTTFITAIFCDYCGKKIWMKEAFKCQSCSMVCHKKCLVKCLVNTICTESGAKKRSAVSEAWEPLTNTGKLKPSAADEVVRNYGFQDDDTDSLAVNENNISTSESMQNLDSCYDIVYVESEKKDSTAFSRQDSLQEANTLMRFRGLKEQTDRMKEGVLKHLRRNKVPAAFNDKAIMSAKEQGARLHNDMEPSLRKDKLEEMVKKLDQELKAERENKESIEQELNQLKQVEQKDPSSKHKSDIKSLSNKVLKSVEKQDAMRLLMLQYCSGLQNCINSLEAEVSASTSQASDFLDGPLGQDFDQRKVSRSAAVGGFVRRASSSVKEKMSLIKKDFGKKGVKNTDDEKIVSFKTSEDDKVTTSKQGKDKIPISKSVEYDNLSVSKKDKNDELPISQSGENIQVADFVNENDDDESSVCSVQNVGVLTSSDEHDRQSLEDSYEEKRFIVRSHLETIVSLEDTTVLKALEEDDSTSSVLNFSDVASAVKHPHVEIYVDEVDTPEPSSNKSNDEGAVKNNFRSQEEPVIPRSSSDSKLEINSMIGLRPEDILRYRGTSLPRLSAIDDYDSDSDYLVINSSDEEARLDSSEDSDNDVNNIGFKDGHRKQANEDSDDERDQHRGTKQKLQTFQV